MAIFDWYLLATTLFGTVVLLTLITLKIALKSEFQMTSAKMTRLKEYQAAQQPITPEAKPTITAERPTKVILSYLLRNHSIAEPCLGRKSCNKLPVLLSLSSISILCFLNPNLILNCLVGLPITLFFLFYRVCSQPEIKQEVMDGQIEDLEHIQRQVKEEDQNQKTINKTKAIYIVYGVIASGFALFLCGATFKNYSNLFLMEFLRNTAISCIVDLAAIKTVGFLLICFPLSYSNRARNFIEMEQMKQLYLEMALVQQQSGLKNFAAERLSPRKKQQTSPSKIPKAVPRLTHTNSQNQALKNALDIAKKIKKQKMPQSSDMLRTLNRLNDVENSAFGDIHQHGTLHQLIDPNIGQNVRGRLTPVAALMNDEDESGTIGNKTRRKDTDLVIVEFKKDDEHQSQKSQNDQQKIDSTIQRRATSFLHSNLDFQDDLNTIYKRDDSNANSGVNPSYNSGDNKLNIVKILDECVENIEEEERENDRRKHENSMTLNLERFDHLHINDGGCDQDGYMEEIDGNSPERRRKVGQGQDSQYKLKKKAKHFNGQAKRRVIRFTSGEPYLQYLPNMLSKDSAIKHKKSQPINTKPDLSTFEQGRKTTVGKKSKTKKQHKYTFGGDENEYPGALEVEDI